MKDKPNALQCTTLILWQMLIVCITALPYPCRSQEPITHYFELESEITLPDNSCAAQPGKIIGCMDGDALYLCNSEVIATRKRGEMATVERWELATQRVSTYKLPLPHQGNSIWRQHRYWLYSLAVQGQRLLLTTSDLLLEYELKHNGDARLIASYTFPDADFGFYDSDGVKAVAQVNDVGFTIMQPSDDQLDSIVTLPLPAPFLLQFRPNRLLQPSGDHLLMLSTPHPILKRFNTRGEELSSTDLGIANWTDMPATYISEIQSIPYSGARAMHIFETSMPYSFPLEMFVLNDTTQLISYHQYDSTTNSLTAPLILLRTNKDGRVIQRSPLRIDYDKEHRLTPDEYPFYYAHRALSLMVAGNQRIIQVVRTSPAPYIGLTQSEYEEEQQHFFAEHPPLMKIRVLRMKRGLAKIAVNRLPLVDNKGNAFHWDTIPSQYAVVVVNRSPQCHACEANLYSCLNGMKIEEGVLYIVERNCNGQLCRRDRLQQIRQQLSAPFTPLYIQPTSEGEFEQMLGQRTYPLVLLIDKMNGSATVLSHDQLFPDDPAQTTVRPEAQYEISTHLP